MRVKVFTLPFFPDRGTFDSSALESFAENHELLSQQPIFFEENGKHWWTIYVVYKELNKEEVNKPKQKLPEMNEGEKALMLKLKAWRKAEAEKRGFPPYLIATDVQFAEMIIQKCRSKQSLESIKRFGKKRIANYGAEILTIIKDYIGHEPQS